MSGSGVAPTNSGPLILRTYGDAGPNNTYILCDYDVPIPGNRALQTGVNGVLAPSIAPYVSSAAVSSATASTATATNSTIGSFLSTTILQCSTVNVGTLYFSSIMGSTIKGNTAQFDTSTSISSITTQVGSNMTITGIAGVTDSLSVRLTYSAPNSVANLGTVSFSNLQGMGQIMTGTMNVATTSTTTVTAALVSSGQLAGSTLSSQSVSTLALSFLNAQTQNLTVHNITANSTLTTSTAYATNFSVNTFNGSSLNYDIAYVTVPSTMTIGTTLAVKSSITFSTMMGSSLIVPTASMMNATFSTLAGSSIIVSSATTGIAITSSLKVSTLQGGTVTVPSTLISTVYGSSIVGSTLAALRFSGTNAAITTITGASIIMAAMSGSSIYGSTFAAPNALVSSATTNATVTSLTGSLTANGQITSATTSSLGVGQLQVSSLVVPILQTALYASTIGLSSLSLSTINGLIVTATSSVGITEKPLVGQGNTAIGASTLALISTGRNNTAIGGAAMYSTLTGSYHTAVGYRAGNTLPLTGSSSIYVGYQAVPSAIAVSNEIVIGGAPAFSTTNQGLGSNTVVFGNGSTLTTVLYGSVGIGTAPTASTLTVAGQVQIGGLAAITNTQQALLQLYNDGLPVSLYLNGSTQPDAGAGTLRNDAGPLILQSAASQLTIQTSGYVMAGQGTPAFQLDVIGGIRCAVDGAATDQDGNTKSLQLSAPSGLSVWMGVDPSRSVGYLAAATATVPKPVCLFGSAVGIGGIPSGSYALEVLGNAHIAGGFTVNGISTNALTITGVSYSQPTPWSTVTGGLSYSRAVQTSTISATYANLPLMTNSTVGAVQCGAGLSVTGGVLTVALPSAQITATTSLYAALAGTFYAWNFTLVSGDASVTTFSMTADSNTISSLSIATAGYYLVQLSGFLNMTHTDTVYLERVSTDGNLAVNPMLAYASAAVSATSVSPIYLSALVYMRAVDHLIVYQAYQPGASQISVTMSFISS